MRRTQRIDTIDSVVINDFGYNARNELTNALMGADSSAYAYDSIGNRLTSSTPSTSSMYAANGLNQYSQMISTNLTTSAVSTNLFSYDADGNLLSDGVVAYSWNGENRLIQVSNENTVVSFVYDYMGRRIEKIVNSTNTTRFIYDDWAIIYEESSGVTNSYVYGLDLSGAMQGAGNIGGLLFANLNGTNVFYAFDANGNVTDMVGTNGVVVAHYDYGAYGNIIAQRGSLAGENPFRFSTKYFDDGLGLYYYGYRYYNVFLGRWLSRDPTAEKGGYNIYVFSLNNGINYIDAFGLETSILYDTREELRSSTGSWSWRYTGWSAYSESSRSEVKDSCGKCLYVEVTWVSTHEAELYATKTTERVYEARSSEYELVPIFAGIIIGSPGGAIGSGVGALIGWAVGALLSDSGWYETGSEAIAEVEVTSAVDSSETKERKKAEACP